MRLRRILCLATIVLSVNVQAQDLRITVNDKGKVGFADQDGNVVIKCEYESAMPFKDGVAIVTKSGKSGMINTSGNVILPLKYTQIQSWSQELYLVKSGKKVGLIDHQGTIVLPVNYSHISKPNCYGKALIALGGKATPNEKKTYMANAKYGIIDIKGKILVVPQYKGLYEFSFDGTNKFPYYEGKRLEYSYHNTVDTLVTDCSYLGFNNNGYSIYNAGIIDGNGNVILASGLYYFVMQPQNGMVRYYNVKKKQTLCGYHNLSTGSGFQAASFDSHIDNIKFWSHGDFMGDIAPVNGTSWSFIDKSGNVLRTGYTSLKHSQITGLWAAKNTSEAWDVFNETNNNVDALSGFGDFNFPSKDGDKEIFSVKKEGKYGCVSRTGEVVVPFEYEQTCSNTYDVIAVKKEGKWGLLSADNKVMVPMQYANVIFPSERHAKHFWVMKSDSLYYHYNMLTSKLSNKGYKLVNNYENGFAYVVPQGVKIEDTPVNRAQLFVPNTLKSTIDAADMSKVSDSYVIIVNTNDDVVFDLPVSTLYMNDVRKEIEKNGGKQLSKGEKKNLLLKITRENRSYDLKSTLGEEEWNY